MIKVFGEKAHNKGINILKFPWLKNHYGTKKLFFNYLKEIGHKRLSFAKT